MALTPLLLAACMDQQPLAPAADGALQPGRAALAQAPDPTPEFVKVKVGSLTRSGYIPSSEIRDINSRGWVVGQSSGRAFLWTPDGGIRELPGLVPNASTSVWAINDSGWSTGQSGSSTGYPHAVLWSPAGVVKDLGALADAATTIGYALNERLDVVGEAVPWQGWNAFLAPSGGAMTVLGDIRKEGNCSPTGITDAGVIALSCNGYFTGMRPFRYHQGSWEKLGPDGARGSTAGMSKFGVISGSQTVNDVTTAAYWAPDGDVYTVPINDSRGYDVNDFRELAGDFPWSGGRRAMIASRAYGVVNLPTVDGAYSHVYGINNIGDVAGAEYFGYLAIPEGTVWRRVLRPEIDVQPAKISLSLSSLVTVYLYSTDGFDASKASATTVRLYPNGTGAGAAVAVRGGVPITSVRDVNGDGLPDRALSFLVSELKAAGLTESTSSWQLTDLSPAPRPYRAVELTPPAVVK
jgi:hypothetical protein